MMNLSRLDQRFQDMASKKLRVAENVALYRKQLAVVNRELSILETKLKGLDASLQRKQGRRDALASTHDATFSDMKMIAQNGRGTSIAVRSASTKLGTLSAWSRKPLPRIRLSAVSGRKVDDDELKRVLLADTQPEVSCMPPGMRSRAMAMGVRRRGVEKGSKEHPGWAATRPGTAPSIPTLENLQQTLASTLPTFASFSSSSFGSSSARLASSRSSSRGGGMRVPQPSPPTSSRPGTSSARNPRRAAVTPRLKTPRP